MSVPTETPVSPPLHGVSQARSASDRQSDPGRAKRSESAVGGELGGRVHTYANNLDTSSPDRVITRYAKRVSQGETRSFVRKISQLPRVRKCGHTVRRKEGVGIVADMTQPPETRISGFRGLYTCASVWACPRCAQVIGITRTGEIRDALTQWQTSGAVIPKKRRAPLVKFNYETGELKDSFALYDEPQTFEAGKVALLTLTVRHTKKDNLEDLWQCISKAWEKTTRGSNVLKRHVPGWIRAVEHTHGKNGWHVHLHVILFVGKYFGDAIENHRKTIFSAWKKACKSLGYSAGDQGQDLSYDPDKSAEDIAGDLSGYSMKETGKWDLANELMGAQIKTAKGENLTPRQILSILVADSQGGDHDFSPEDISRYRAIYQEFEAASHGKKQLTWSAGLKTAFKIGEISDEEISETTDDDSDDEQDADVNKGTQEIAGFPESEGWAYWRTYRAEFQLAVESCTQDTLETSLEAVATLQGETLGSDLLIGQKWVDHMDKNHIKIVK